MMKTSEISRRFLEEKVLPVVAHFEKGLDQRVAAGMLGFGSDAAGLDDLHSHDHHWGPRVNLVLGEEDAAQARDLQHCLRERLPSEFEGVPIHHEDANRAGVTAEGVDAFFRQVLGVSRPPETPVGWVKLCEADLCHAVGGILFCDPLGEMSARIEAFRYYPDAVWLKRIADWFIMMSSHGPYNLARCIKRHDEVAAAVYLGESVKKLMEIGFMLNRRYAPYNKWLYRGFANLPRLADTVAPLLKRATTAAAWDDRQDALLTILEIYMRDVHAEGLVRVDHLKPRDAGIALNESLYDFAVEMLTGVPEELKWARFNEIERWETTVKEVILDSAWKDGFTLEEKG